MRQSGENRLSIFSGYPAPEIARWCGVSIKTARDWKAGRRKPSRQALRLFTLHRDGRVLSEPWRGWAIKGTTIVDPEGNATTLPQLRGYYLLLQYAAELAARDPKTQAAWWELMKASA